MQHLLTGFEYSKEEYQDILKTAKDMKANKKAYRHILDGASAALLFEKPSLRTRTTFELAMFNLGGHGVYLDEQGGQMGTRETVADYARNLTKWVDCIVGRVFLQKTLEDLAKWGEVPVINALSDLYHPAQAMADYLTVEEQLGKVEGVHLAYVGDGNNVTNSLLVAGAILGANVTCFCPEGHGPNKEIFDKANEIAKKNNVKLEVTSDITSIKNVNVLYTDTWVSMGDNTPLDAVKKLYMPYQINDDLVAKSGCDIVLHCLPAHRNYEITDSVMDGAKSRVFFEAENRLYIHMSLLSKLIKL